MTAPVRGSGPVVRDGVLERAFFERVSRRRFVRRGAAVAGGFAALGVLGPTVAYGRGPKHGREDGDPSPIPGGFLIGSDGSFTPVPSNPTFHALPPVVGFEMSTITDFDGLVAAADIQGTARDNKGGTYWFDCDMRVMKGRYVDDDGKRRDGVFGFI
jgi:hypothetical protein